MLAAMFFKRKQRLLLLCLLRLSTFLLRFIQFACSKHGCKARKYERNMSKPDYNKYYCNFKDSVIGGGEIYCRKAI